MAHLIDKDALVAEIERLKANYGKCPTHNSYEEGLKEGRLIGYKDALHKINTLEVKEVKEVDLEKEYLSIYWSNEKDLHPFLDLVAKHFFELGLKAQKGENV